MPENYSEASKQEYCFYHPADNFFPCLRRVGFVNRSFTSGPVCSRRPEAMLRRNSARSVASGKYRIDQPGKMYSNVSALGAAKQCIEAWPQRRRLITLGFPAAPASVGRRLRSHYRPSSIEEERGEAGSLLLSLARFGGPSSPSSR